MCSFPFAPIQILTGDIRKVRNTRRGRLLDERRSFPSKSRIERRFESSPESRGSQTSGVLLVLFVQAKRIKSFPFGKVRGSANLDSARRNGGFALTKLKPSQRGDSRFCKPRFSPPKQQLPTNKIKSFCRFAAFASPSAALSVAVATNLCASRYYRRLRRLFVLPAATDRRLAATSFSYFL